MVARYQGERSGMLSLRVSARIMGGGGDYFVKVGPGVGALPFFSGGVGHPGETMTLIT